MYCISNVKMTIKCPRYLETIYRECKKSEHMVLDNEVFEDFVGRLRHTIDTTCTSSSFVLSMSHVNEGTHGIITVFRKYDKGLRPQCPFVYIHYTKLCGRVELANTGFRVRVTNFINDIM